MVVQCFEYSKSSGMLVLSQFIKLRETLHPNKKYVSCSKRKKFQSANSTCTEQAIKRIKEGDGKLIHGTVYFFGYSSFICILHTCEIPSN